jgi:hypothetical protein
MDKLWATIVSGIEAFSLNIIAFLANHMPQLIKRESNFIYL